jgi:hypothetical protein
LPSASRQRSQTVHPRMRGEHAMTGALTTPSSGSSPHARGTRYYVAVGILSGRFIPACAGNTPIRRRPKPPQQVHPRMCGGHSLWEPSNTSPTVHPACTGNTSTHADGRSRRLAHPRMRGERTRISTYAIESVGSSPRARGTRYYVAVGILSGRFIPACAGNTVLRVCRFTRTPVHPRMRGEHRTADFPIEDGGGSSPHARGTRK